VLRLDTGRWTLSDTRAGDVSVRAEPFEDLELRLGELWDGEVLP
jgi:hypothetical protein